MKTILRSFAAIMILLAGFTACNKEEGISENDKLVGTWKSTAGVLVFNGETVSTNVDNVDPAKGIPTFTFDDKNATILDIEGTREFRFTFLGGIITMTQFPYNYYMLVNSLTESELVLDILVTDYEETLNGNVVGQYKDIDIYSNVVGDYKMYWYYNGLKVVPCTSVTVGGETVWYDRLRITLKKS